MFKKNKPKIGLQIAKKFKSTQNKDQISIGEFVDSMGETGFGLLILIFAFGIIIPTPPPFPSIISIPLVIFGYQMLIGNKAPVLPKTIAKYSVNRNVLAALVKKSASIIYRIEKILKPRLPIMFNDFFEKLTGAFILLFSSFILLPIPLSNYIPGIGILIIAFGILTKDGLAVIVGMLVGYSGVLFSIGASWYIIIKSIEFIANIDLSQILHAIQSIIPFQFLNNH
jgi:hypothetical protein